MGKDQYKESGVQKNFEHKKYRNKNYIKSIKTKIKNKKSKKL